jgi:5-methylcytosine-specific restriction endonuclease McrA
MASDVPASLRQLVAERADYCCEYCLLPQAVTLHQHEPDHIVPRQHSGETHKDNLALACLRWKVHSYCLHRSWELILI